MLFKFHNPHFLILSFIYFFLSITLNSYSTLPLNALIESSPPPINDFMLMTQPKGGTHVIIKLFQLMIEKKPHGMWSEFPQLFQTQFIGDNPNAFISESDLENSFKKIKSFGAYPVAHCNFLEPYQMFALNHPEYVKFVLIRDLRDVCVSTVFFQRKLIEEEIGSSNFDDLLLFVITMGNKTTEKNIFQVERHARNALEFMKDPKTVVCKFENLIGEEGGGSSDLQRKEIILIADALNLTLKSNRIDKIQKKLYGIKKGPNVGGNTFRSGKIGHWQGYFKPYHKEAFNKALGDLQEALGYTSCSK